MSKSWARRLMGILGGEQFDHKWQLTQNFKKVILQGNVEDFVCKALCIEILQVRKDTQFPECDRVELRIKIQGQDKDDAIYLDCKDGLMVGDTLTVLDLNHAFVINIS